MKRLREEFAPRKAQPPQVTVEIPPAGIYDALLPSAQGDEPEEVAAPRGRRDMGGAGSAHVIHAPDMLSIGRMDEGRVLQL